MNKAWKDIEGMPFRIDVGSTSQQAMSNRTPASVLHLTTDEEIVMNGVKFYDARITKTEDNLAELLKRIQGTSDDSSAYTDPFRFFGEYDTIDDAATALADVNFLDKKNQGSLRIEVGGEIFDVHNYLLREKNIVLGYNVSTCLQTIEGVLSATDGVLVLNDDDKEYKKYCRTISRKRNSFTNLEENIATSWKELYEDEIATIKSDIAANAEATSANACNISKLQDADTKLKKLIRGIADDSSARTDPFLFLGEYDNDDTSTGLEKAMAALDGLDYSQTKYAGLVRLRVNGVPVDVHNYVRGYAAKHITQTIEGAIVVTDGEITSINSGTFAKYWRNIQGENIGKWQKYGETASSANDINSIEDRLTTALQNITTIQTQLAQLQTALPFGFEVYSTQSEIRNAIDEATYKEISAYSADSTHQIKAVRFYAYENTTAVLLQNLHMEERGLTVYQVLYEGGSWYNRWVRANEKVAWSGGYG